MVQAVQTWQTKLKLMLFHGGSSTDAWFTMTAAQVTSVRVVLFVVSVQYGAAKLHLCKCVAWVVAENVRFMVWKQGHSANRRLCV